MSDVRAALRWGAWVFGGVALLVFYRSAALDTAVTYGHRDVQRAAYAVSVGAWIMTVCLLPVDVFRLRLRPGLGTRSRRWIAGVLLVLTIGPAGAATFALPAEHQHVDTSWAVATNGWILLAIVSRRNTAVLLTWLAMPPAFAMLVAATGGSAAIVVMSARTLGILGLQVPVALAARSLERSADAASALRLRREAIRTEQVVADALHDDRLLRSRAVADVIEPVLAVLAEPAADPDLDDAVRRRCEVAAAQVRRLLAKWHRGGPDPLGPDLAACIDQLQAAGVRVDVAVHVGPPAELPPTVRRVASDVVRHLAGGTGTRLRVTVLGTAAQVVVSVVARTAPGVADERRPRLPITVPAPLTVRTTTADDAVWVEITCPL